MRIALLLFSLSALAPSASTADEEKAAPAPRGALRGADCLDPSMARSWEQISGDELLVDAGRRKYRIRLAEYCTELGNGSVVAFRGDPVSGRVCGNISETVLAGRVSCRIESVELIDAETYREATGDKRGTVSASKAD